MQSLVNYLRDFLRPREDEIPAVTTKRDRDNDDDPPVMKKYKTVKSHFPKIMPSDEEEEWILPKRIGTAQRVRYIPIVQEDQPSTSTPSTQPVRINNDLKKPFETLDLGRSPIDPSPLKQSSFLTEKPLGLTHSPLLSRTEIPNITKNPLSFFKQSGRNLDTNNLQSLNHKSFFKKPDFSSNLSHLVKDKDPYKFHGNDCTKSKYFKPSNKSPVTPKENVEIVEISDSEDNVYYIMKKPKETNSQNRCARHQEVNEPDDESDDEDELPSGRHCEICRHMVCNPYMSHVRRSMSPKVRRDPFARFKTPLSTSKAKLNSFTPFWKSQKKNSNAPRGGRLPSRTIIEKCVRLDDKKKYEELISLATSSYFRKTNPHKPSLFDLTETHKRIKDLTSSINSSNSFEVNSNNHVLEKDFLDDQIVVLSDSDPEQVFSADDSSTSSSVRIVPVNSLKQSFKQNSITSSNWMEDLNKKYGKIQLDKKQEAKDCLFISKSQSDSNHEFYLKKNERQIKLSKIDLTLEPEEIEEVALPELSNEQQAIINNALRPNPPSQVLVEKFNLAVTRRDINTLAGLNWLNDEVINFYMNLIMERSKEKKDLPKVYGMNTFFYPKLMQTGQAGLKRWTKKVDIFSYDLIVVPVHLGVHWCVSIVDFRNKCVKYYDSMGGVNMDCCDALLKYLEDESMDKRKTKYDTSSWKKECVKDIPQQMNGSDCGMFSCTFAEFISRGAPITFSQSEMPYLRRKMILEIVQGALLL